jgi:SAM-dependent methyltransferase
MNELIKRLYYGIFPPWTVYLKKELSACKTVLDLGCGNNSPLQHIPVPYSMGVDLYYPYLEASKKRRIHTEYMMADIRQIEFKEQSFDAVLLLDVIEHLAVQEGKELISKALRWAKRKVVVVTPNGFIWQEGYDCNPLQNHKTGWSVDQLEELGFKVVGIYGWKKLRLSEIGIVSKARVRYKPTQLWALVADLTQKVTHHHPKFAFELLATKAISAGRPE